ncbi:hypothetical protein [Bradyrhizobium sp. G127]|uniref:hypothetical protein n=1 Tax=Bradyrhizobium sp. G127 TaxID=2904800 RepID=UPI001F325D0D|nr:hypothetical protein [Bradyrhizobium sp. G127]MCF2523231.1 hypothetical protein [Bradyrhizobium sp. G127]
MTYDLKATTPSPYRAFASCAEAEGLIYVYKTGEKLSRLTNTTLWGLFQTKAAVRDAFDRAQAAAEHEIGIKITLEKRVITQMADVFVRSDKQKVPEPKWTKSSRFETCRTHQKNDPFFSY